MIRAPVDDQTNGLKLETRLCGIELRLLDFSGLFISWDRRNLENRSQHSLSDGGFMRSVNVSVFY